MTIALLGPGGPWPWFPRRCPTLRSARNATQLYAQFAEHSAGLDFSTISEI